MSNFVEKKNIFKGMTMSQMKDMYSKMTAKERGQFAGAFVRAAKTAKKPATKRQQTPTKPTTTAKTKPVPTKPKASDKAVKGGYTISPEKRKPGTRGASEQPKPRRIGRSNMPYAGRFPGEPAKKKDEKQTPKAGDTKTVKGQKYYYDGNKWVKGTSIPTRFKR